MPKPISEISAIAGVAETTKEPVKTGGVSNESTPRPSRRRFTAAQKLRFVKAADAALASGKRGALGSLLRREGLYSSQLSSWRRQLAQGGWDGLESKKRGRKPTHTPDERELRGLKKRNAALERKLEVANAVIDLQKKVHAILGLALPHSDENS